MEDHGLREFANAVMNVICAQIVKKIVLSELRNCPFAYNLFPYLGSIQKGEHTNGSSMRNKSLYIYISDGH